MELLGNHYVEILYSFLYKRAAICQVTPGLRTLILNPTTLLNLNPNPSIRTTSQPVSLKTHDWIDSNRNWQTNWNRTFNIGRANISTILNYPRRELDRTALISLLLHNLVRCDRGTNRGRRNPGFKAKQKKVVRCLGNIAVASSAHLRHEKKRSVSTSLIWSFWDRGNFKRDGVTSQSQS